MVKKRIPGVEVGPMEVDPGSYPSLGRDSASDETAKGSAAKRRRTDKAAAASGPAAAASPPAAAAAPEPDSAVAEPASEASAAPPEATAPEAAAPEATAPEAAPLAAGRSSGAAPPPPPPVSRPARRGDGGERQSGLIAAAVAGLVAVVALAVAWSGRGDEARLQAQIQAADARIATQVAELRQAGDDNLDAVALLLESEQEDRRALAGSLALLRLDARARAGGPFLAELQLAVELMADDPSAREHLATLAASAEQGLPPRALLRSAFEEAVLEPARPSSAAALFTSISSSIGGSISGLVARVMPNGRAPAAPDTRFADLARAEMALIADDLEAAVAAVRPHGSALAPARQWLAVAERRLEAERALAALDNVVEEVLGRFH